MGLPGRRMPDRGQVEALLFRVCRRCPQFARTPGASRAEPVEEEPGIEKQDRACTRTPVMAAEGAFENWRVVAGHDVWPPGSRDCALLPRTRPCRSLARASFSFVSVPSAPLWRIRSHAD